MPTPRHQMQTDSELFRLVQLLRLFGDSKPFPDLDFDGDPDQLAVEFDTFLASFYGELRQPAPARPSEAVLASISEAMLLTRKLHEWVGERFGKPAQPSLPPLQGRPMSAHIEAMWARLTRSTAAYPHQHTLIPLPQPYIVPGGRYIEAYYWDSYFTCVGLLATGQIDLLRGMVENFVHLIETLGYIPNGNRTYYLGRSQAPYFSFMIGLIEKANGRPFSQDEARRYFAALAKEYQFWTETPHAVALTGEVHLNRFWDSNETPRPEGYWEDVGTALEAGHGPESPAARTLYRHLRAGAESGWDFSSRWIAQTAAGKYPLTAIRTTHVLPVDLNSLLYALETRLAALATVAGEAAQAQRYAAAAQTRRGAILALFWDAAEGWFVDRVSPLLGQSAALDPHALGKTGVISLAGAYPLFCGVLDPHADRAIVGQVVARLMRDFFKTTDGKGGVVTSLVQTGQQWDWPNGWAPLQWVAVAGLLNVGYVAESRAIAAAFVALAEGIYVETGKMMEKYNVVNPNQPGGGGEYPNQEGFGWTNGVVAAFQHLDRFVSRPT